MTKARLAAAVIAAMVFAATTAWLSSASAFDETGKTDGSEQYCISECHGSVFQPSGPHGAYGRSTNKCRICHSVHAAPEDGVKLLPGASVVATCFTCHDGTGGQGVYGTIAARTGQPPAGGHRYSATSVIPGGDATTGGSATRTFRETSTGNLICTDCHSPHGSDLVAAFTGERARSENMAQYKTPRLLRRRPGGAPAPVDEYGSDWCLGCHEGRGSAGAVHNHPVESSATAGGDAYVYERLPVLAPGGPTGETVLGPLAAIDNWPEFDLYWAQSNRAFLMPYPRTPLQEGRAPICQQCHEDTRSAGSLSADGSVATPNTGELWEQNVDGRPDDPEVSTANPRFQNFPHETVNARLLVETGDDLCMNCHPPAALP
ncbi:MAG: hypothetical protein IBX62_07760 [Coriobacteriia bacterium]|nr:hypothetical protein [Coriobacteriia bacterium]